MTNIEEAKKKLDTCFERVSRMQQAFLDGVSAALNQKFETLAAGMEDKRNRFAFLIQEVEQLEENNKHDSMIVTGFSSSLREMHDNI